MSRKKILTAAMAVAALVFLSQPAPAAPGWTKCDCASVCTIKQGRGHGAGDPTGCIASRCGRYPEGACSQARIQNYLRGTPIPASNPKSR